MKINILLLSGIMGVIAFGLTYANHRRLNRENINFLALD